MDLRGAENRNFYEITKPMEQGRAKSEPSTKTNIPFYQRPYKWEKSNVKALIDDWQSESRNESINGEYFAGSIVTVADDEKQKHDLVDGQQRFTTIFLANYLLMLILRVSLREAISQNKLLPLMQLYNDFKESLDNLLCNYEKSNIFSSDTDIEGIFANLNKETQRDEITKNFCKEVFLPNIPSGDPKYNQQYERKLKEYIHNNLKLVYSRISYNKLLQDSLKKVIIKLNSEENLSIFIDYDRIRKGTAEERILDAMRQLFDSFEVVEEPLPFKNAERTIESIKKFLKELKVCVIQTGNPNDAYTLFEVLNDRSMRLDDLDLIKNLFYKTFCLDGGETDDKAIDTQIDNCEIKWIKIFNNKVVKRRLLISYLAASYISGNTDISQKSNHNHRTAISNYLTDKYDRDENRYNQQQLTKDFNIFYAVMLLLEEFDVAHAGVPAKAVKAEYEDKTITYKAVHLLHALDMPGVLAGLVNFILRYIDNLEEVDDFDPEEVKKIIEALRDDNEEHTEIHNQAKQFWKCALLSADHKLPWELAKRVISSSNRSSGVGQQELRYYARTPKIDLSSWADGWKFNQEKPKTKIRVLFARLIRSNYDFEKEQLSENDDFFIFAPAIDSVKELELDHMEPTNPNPAHPDDYFQDQNRKDIIDSLGNMMPLPKSVNSSKGNNPMYKIFGALADTGLADHWLTTATAKILEEKSNHKKKGELKIPKNNFFDARKKFLIKCFDEAINNECQ
jgi:uncharacterized protein with ParB-like and HNH nuclease domain